MIEKVRVQGHKKKTAVTHVCQFAVVFILSCLLFPPFIIAILIMGPVDHN